jgi:nucleoside-diphosphate-sugar epimerase
MKTLLITGASGFIGKSILKYIEKHFCDKYHVVLLSSAKNDRFSTILPYSMPLHNNYTFTKNDFLDKGIKNIDIVLHMGAFTPKSSSEANDILKSNQNVCNTQHLLYNLPNTPKKLIYLSTIDVYGKANEIINEETLTKPLTMYGWSKLYSEKMVEAWASSNNIVFQILRVGHIYGRGEEAYKKIIPETIRRIKNNENPRVFGLGEEKRAFLHVDDVCTYIRLI